MITFKLVRKLVVDGESSGSCVILGSDCTGYCWFNLKRRGNDWLINMSPTNVYCWDTGWCSSKTLVSHQCGPEFDSRHCKRCMFVADYYSHSRVFPQGTPVFLPRSSTIKMWIESAVKLIFFGGSVWEGSEWIVTDRRAPYGECHL